LASFYRIILLITFDIVGSWGIIPQDLILSYLSSSPFFISHLSPFFQSSYPFFTIVLVGSWKLVLSFRFLNLKNGSLIPSISYPVFEANVSIPFRIYSSIISISTHSSFFIGFSLCSVSVVQLSYCLLFGGQIYYPHFLLLLWGLLFFLPVVLWF